MTSAEKHAEKLIDQFELDAEMKSGYTDFILCIQKDMEIFMEERFAFWKSCNVYINPHKYKTDNIGLWDDLEVLDDV
jgi:hypothetical protein